ncbi:PorV/PorQ family protein, partial [bacterium]|nr:PorV/PorQ family protein [bacterium]
MKKCIAAWSMLFLMTSMAEAGGPGTTNANFLKAGQGVRPVAMGETYIALGDGLDTLYWNPAGLVQMTAPAAGFIHTFWVQDIGTEYLAFGMPLGPLGAVGGGITVVQAGTIEKTLEDASGNYAGTEGRASALQMALVGVFSQKLSRIIPVGTSFLQNVLVGAGIRLVSESIDEVNIFGGGLDIGVIWRQTEQVSSQDLIRRGGWGGAKRKSAARDNGWRLGLVAQNLGLTTDELMPINFRVGAGYLVQEVFSPNGRGTLGLDVLIPIDNQVKISLGGEYAHITPHTEFAARAGYKLGNEIKDLDSLAGLTVGAGVAIRSGSLKYKLDYAFVPYGELGSAHRVSLTLAFLPDKRAVFSRGAEPAQLSPAPIKTGSLTGMETKPERAPGKSSEAAIPDKAKPESKPETPVLAPAP